MQPSPRTFVFCKKHEGHVIGELVQCEYHGSRVSALLLYEQSLYAVPAAVPKRRAKIVGDAPEIECTVCGAVQDWFIGKKAAFALLRALYEPGKRTEVKA